VKKEIEAELIQCIGAFDLKILENNMYVRFI